MHESPTTEDTDPRQTALAQALLDHQPVANGPHVWIGSVASYEAAAPRGRWLTLNQPVIELERAVAAIVGESAVDDDERWGAYAEIGFGRYPPPITTTVSELVARARLAREELRAFHAWADLGGNDHLWVMQFYDRYLGRYDHFHDWLTLEIERAGWDRLIDRVLPAELRLHVEINLESFGHDLLASGVVFTAPDPASDGVFVFRGCSP